jgi:hypothetical protein
MPKRIIKKRANGITNDSLMPSNNDLDLIYNNYIFSFIYKSPFEMGSPDILLALYNNIDNILKFTVSGSSQKSLFIIRDILVVLTRSQHVYYDNVLMVRQLETLRKKYDISEKKIIELIEKLLIAQDSDQVAKGVFSGTLGIKLKKLPNLIYVQALLNLDFAWYQYLHNKQEYDAILMNSTKSYVRSLGTKEDAYNKLISILDERFKDIDDVVDNTIENNNN